MRQKSISRAPGATPRWLPNPVKAWRAGLAIALLWAPSPALAASVVTEWTETLLEEMVLTHPEPTSASRMAAIVYTAMYDAWAAYDPVAVGAITANTLDGTGGEATEANRAEAMSHAAFHTLSLLARRKNPSIDQMDALDFEVGDTSLPAILGRRVAAAVMDVRRTDGANHVHFYQDTSNYMIAPPSDLASWQPIVFENMLQEPTTPHWDRVTPFALPSPDALRPPPPPRPGSAAFEAEVATILTYREQLTAQHKAIAEYWLPHGGTPASHLIHLTEELSEDRAWTLEEDIKTFFVVANALLDAGIAAWDAKYHYNFVRPETALADVKFRPYLDTPPFPEYVSGHSAFTAAWAAALEGITGSPEYGYTTRVQILREGNRVLLSGRTLSFPTFWSAAESSGQSRLYGGIHWPVGNTEGLALGRAAGEAAFAKAVDHFEGRAMPLTAALAFRDAPLWRPMPDGAHKTIMLDPPTAGDYVLTIELDAASGETEVFVYGDAAGSRVLGRARHTASGEGGRGVLTVAWASDGVSPFAVEVRGPIDAMLTIGAMYNVYKP